MVDAAANRTRHDLSLSGAGAVLSRATRAGAWTIGGRILIQVGNLVRLFVLARLLAPSDFGLFGIALLAVNTLETFTEGGLSAALIQRHGDISQHLNVAFAVNIVRGILGAIALVLAAPFVAMFFENSRATDVVRVVAVIFLLRSLVNPAVVYFSRSLEFRRLFMLTLAEVTVGLAVAVPLAVAYRNVWALLLSLIASQLARTVGSYLVTRTYPRPRVSFPVLRALMDFGKWVTFANVIVFVVHTIDDVLVGKLLGTAALGLYQLTFRIANLPATDLSDVVGQVTFPAYTSLQFDASGLRYAYLQVLRVTGLLAIPAAVTLGVAGPDLFAGVLGQRWMPAVATFQVLCVFSLVRALNGTLAPLFQAVGRPSILTLLSGAQLCVLAVIIYPLTMLWGLEGAAIAVTLANVIPMIAGSVTVSRMLGIEPRAFGRALWLGLRAGVLICGSVLAARSLLSAPPLTMLAVDAAIVITLSPLVLSPLWQTRYAIGGRRAVVE